MYPSNLYRIELQWRVYYTFFSFFLLFTVIFSHADIFLLLEVKPLVNLGYNTLIVTQITDLINSVVQSVFYISCIAIFPLFSYHFYSFLLPSLYYYQAMIFQAYLSYTFSLWALSFLVIYLFLLPEIFKFFFYWEMQSTSVLFQVVVNVRIQEYLVWTLKFYNLLGSTLHLFLCFFIIMLSWYTTLHLFFLFSSRKKHILFILVFTCYFVIPPDMTLQTILLLYLVFFVEIIFFAVHFRLKQLTVC